MKRKTFTSIIGLGASVGLALMSTPAQAATDSTPSPSSQIVQSTVSVAEQAVASAY